MNKKFECKRHQIYSKMLKRSILKKPYLNFIKVNKNSSFDQSFVYVWLKPLHKISWSVLKMSLGYHCNFIMDLRHEIFQLCISHKSNSFCLTLKVSHTFYNPGQNIWKN